MKNKFNPLISPMNEWWIKYIIIFAEIFLNDMIVWSPFMSFYFSPHDFPRKFPLPIVSHGEGEWVMVGGASSVSPFLLSVCVS